ncbi:MAG: hypothetical protein ACR2NX_07990 [Chthoniobacterales bacterium]
MPDSSISVVPIGKKVCRPFLVEVMIFSPEAGYKFKVQVERSCTPEADAIWKLVFDLYRVTGGNEVQLVHVSFTSGTPVEQKSVQGMVSEGVKTAQADVLVGDVYPATKAVAGTTKPTPAQKKKIHGAMQKVVNVDV